MSTRVLGVKVNECGARRRPRDTATADHRSHRGPWRPICASPRRSRHHERPNASGGPGRGSPYRREPHGEQLHAAVIKLARGVPDVTMHFELTPLAHSQKSSNASQAGEAAQCYAVDNRSVGRAAQTRALVTAPRPRTRPRPTGSPSPHRRVRRRSCEAGPCDRLGEWPARSTSSGGWG